MSGFPPSFWILFFREFLPGSQGSEESAGRRAGFSWRDVGDGPWGNLVRFQEIPRCKSMTLIQIPWFLEKIALFKGFFLIVGQHYPFIII